MFGIGPGEMFIFALVTLIAVGPDKLPQFVKTVSKGLRDLRQARDNFRREAGIDELLREDFGLDEVRNLRRDMQRKLDREMSEIMSGDDAQEHALPRFTAEDAETESPQEGVDVHHAMRSQNARTENEVVGTLTASSPGQTSAVAGKVEGKKKAQQTLPQEPTMLGLSPVDPYDDADAARALAGKAPLAKPAQSVPPPPPAAAKSRSTSGKTSVPPPPPASKPPSTSKRPPPPTLSAPSSSSPRAFSSPSSLSAPAVPRSSAPRRPSAPPAPSTTKRTLVGLAAPPLGSLAKSASSLGISGSGNTTESSSTAESSSTTESSRSSARPSLPPSLPPFSPDSEDDA